jgi:small-conductance mechanosensitive channel
MLQIFGIKLVGVTPENGRKLLLSVILIVFLFLLSNSLSWLAGKIFTRRDSVRVTFWSQQAIHIFTAAVLILGLVSIWFEDPTKLTTAAGMVTAGVAFALQRVITAFAGYFVILRGKTFNVGDRIVMAGVRGDVIDLGFMQTTVMEMGQPPPVQSAPPAVWVRGRQYTGRIVTITNDKIFDEPVYNYSRDFPYLWEEMTLPVSYQSDRKRAEEILLEIARKHTVKINELGEDAIQNLERRYFMRRSELGPRVFFRLTDNWLEMSLRFLAQDAGVRELKDAMSRDIIDQLDQAGIGVASGTYEIVGLPPVRVVMDEKKQNGNENGSGKTPLLRSEL